MTSQLIIIIIIFLHNYCAYWFEKFEKNINLMLISKLLTLILGWKLINCIEKLKLQIY